MARIIDAQAYSAGHVYAAKLLGGLPTLAVELAVTQLQQRVRDDDELSDRERDHYEGAIDWCTTQLRQSSRRT